MSDRAKFMIVVGVVLAGIVIGLVFPFAVDNTKRMRDAEKAAKQQSTEQPAATPQPTP